MAKKSFYWFCKSCRSRNLACKPITCGTCGQRREDAPPPIQTKNDDKVNAEWDALQDGGFDLSLPL